MPVRIARICREKILQLLADGHLCPTKYIAAIPRVIPARFMCKLTYYYYKTVLS